MNDRIRELRKTLRLTMEEFGEKVGVTRSAISNIEAGKRSVTEQMINSVCREFKVNEIWLRAGNGEMFTQDATSEIDALAQKYDLSDAECILIDKFVKLRPEIREAFTSFIQEVAVAIGKEDVEQKPELDIEAEVEDYRRQLEEQKKAEARLSASDGGSSTMKKEA